MIENRIRESLQGRAEAVETSSDAWDGILRGLRRRRARARLQQAGISASVLALFAGALIWSWSIFLDRSEVEPADVGTAPASVDPRVADVIDVGRYPAGIAAGDGSAWVSIAGAGECKGEIVRLGLRNGEAVETARIPFEGWPGDLAVGLGAVWAEGFRCADGGDQHGGVLRIDPVSDAVVGFIPTGPGGFVSDVAVGEGAVWVTRTVRGSSGEVLRIDPETGSIQGRIPISGDPRDVVVAEGSVWILTIVGDEDLSSLEVLRIDPDIEAVVDRVPDALGLGAGEGAVWVPVWLTENEIGLQVLDVGTLEVEETFRGDFIGFSGDHGTLGSFPVGEGGAWLLHRPVETEPVDLVRVTLGGRGVDATVSPSGTDWGIDAALDPSTDSLWLARFEDAVVRVELR
jgi:hypothetical protein